MQLKSLNQGGGGGGDVSGYGKGFTFRRSSQRICVRFLCVSPKEACISVALPNPPLKMGAWPPSASPTAAPTPSHNLSFSGSHLEAILGLKPNVFSFSPHFSLSVYNFFLHPKSLISATGEEGDGFKDPLRPVVKSVPRGLLVMIFAIFSQNQRTLVIF